jgi:hypothetical protein
MSGTGCQYFNQPHVLTWSSVNAYDFPSVFGVHVCHFDCDYLELVVYPQLRAGNVFFKTNEHTPTAGTPVSSESCEVIAANFLSTP